MFRYPSGITALSEVNLRFDGGTTAIIGQNGAGKTTLVKHFNGLLLPTGGDMLVDGRSTRGQTVASLARSVGLVFQNPNDQIFNPSVWKEAAFGPRNLGFPPERVRALVADALALVGLRERADVHPYELTLSERKLLCIAAVLAMDTPVVVLDEPTTGQDQRGMRQIAGLIRHVQERGRTVIAITHDMGLVADAFERTVVMAHGRVLLDGDTRSVFAQTATLAEARVEPPVVIRLAQRLGLPGTPLNVAEFCALHALHTIGTVAGRAER
jgi:energy-coupling factor transport system ATP-binding protein